MLRFSASIIAIMLWSTAAISQTVDTLFLNDIDTLKSWVESLHPDPFARTSEKDWEKAYRKAITNASSNIDEHDKILILSDFIKTIKDSHSSVSLGTWAREIFAEFGRPQINLIIKGGKIFSTEGVHVVEICGVRDSVLIKNARRLALLEGDNYHAENLISGALVAPLAMMMGDAQPGVLIAKTLVDGVETELTMYTDLSRSKGNVDPVKWVWPKEGEENKIAYLKINSFSSGKKRAYYRTINKGFKKLKLLEDKGGVDALIIDLRGNLGGSINRMKHVVRHLSDTNFYGSHALVQRQCKELKELYKKVPFYQELAIGATDTLLTKESSGFIKWNFDGEMALLVNGKSASASVTFATLFKRLDLGPVFGSAPLGSVCGTSANPIYRKLPNSKIEMCIATAQLAMDSTFKWSSYPITPTRWVEHSEGNISIDPTERAIRDWLRYPEVSVNELTLRESKQLFSDLETVLGSTPSWTGETRAKAFESIKIADAKIIRYDKQIKELQASDISEDELIYKVMGLQGIKKSAKNYRNATISLALPQELRIVFEELTSETRPAVLHFGIHNRADCNVCIKK